MVTIVILVAIALLAGGGYWSWSRRVPARDSTPRAVHAPKPFAGVEIRLRLGACEAAQALEGERFLSNQAPALPLPDCTAARCSCNFVKLSDRRTEDERRLGHQGLKASLFLNAERRNPGDRRD
jgi:hypothetical protein